MPEERKDIFRKKSLDRLSSPDSLDQVLHIVRPSAWIALLATAGVLGLAVTWSIVGRVPLTADGVALLARPRQIVAFQAPARGQIDGIDVQVGDRVSKGQVIGRLHQPEIEKELEQAQLRLRNTVARDEEMLRLEAELAGQELELLDQHKQLIVERMDMIRQRADRAKLKADSAIEKQYENIGAAQGLTAELEQSWGQREAAYESLLEDQLVSQEQELDLHTRVIDHKLRIAELDVQGQELELRRLAAVEAHETQMDRLSDLDIQLMDLEINRNAILRRKRERELDATARAEAIQGDIDILGERLAQTIPITSEYQGRVVEVVTFEGERVEVGHRLGKIEIEDDASELMAVAYFRVEDGKKIEAGHSILVTPSTVERERHGGIVGQVVDVSDYPVTTLAAANVIGDVEIARALLGGESRIQVQARLERDPTDATRYHWSSTGSEEERADHLVSAGTTARVRVTIEERAPITFVLPFLRGVAGL